MAANPTSYPPPVDAALAILQEHQIDHDGICVVCHTRNCPPRTEAVGKLEEHPRSGLPQRRA